ncbi:MAG: PocR ligand-binding domain-containing protein [Bacillota bacterium]
MNSLEDMINEGTLGRIIRSFREATALVAVVIDTSGEPVLMPRAWENCAVCRLVRSSPEGRARCSASYADAGRQAARLGNLHVFKCHAGLVNWAAPLVVGTRHVGSIICGQVTMWEPAGAFVREVAERIKDLGIEHSILQTAVSELERVSAAKVQAAAELLFAVATYVVQSKDLALRQQQEIARQQALLHEAVHKRKRLEQDTRAAGGIYSRARERELLSAVRSGDRAKAKGVLNDMVAGVLLVEPTRLDILKARLLELAVFLSRAAVEAGADLERLLGLNYHCLEELSHLNTLEELCFWIVRMLDQFMDSACEAAGNGHKAASKAVLREAVRYMRDNIKEKLTVERIAAAVHVSPSHLSHLFRQELGTTVMDYMTGIRLEEAKRLLCDLQYNVSQVAEMVGYQDPAHFSKCFKRSEGISPTTFRQRMAG